MRLTWARQSVILVWVSLWHRNTAADAYTVGFQPDSYFTEMRHSEQQWWQFVTGTGLGHSVEGLRKGVFFNWNNVDGLFRDAPWSLARGKVKSERRLNQTLYINLFYPLLEGKQVQPADLKKGSPEIPTFIKFLAMTLKRLPDGCKLKRLYWPTIWISHYSNRPSADG